MRGAVRGDCVLSTHYGADRERGGVGGGSCTDAQERGQMTEATFWGNNHFAVQSLQGQARKTFPF